jgi:hypothetical protein
MPATTDDTLFPFSLPNVCKKKITPAFDGGTISSDGGVFLLAGADKRLGLIDALAKLFPTVAIRPRTAIPSRSSFESVSSQSLVDIPTATISTRSELTPPSRWRAGGRRRAVPIWRRNPRCRGWRTRPTFAR